MSELDEEIVAFTDAPSESEARSLTDMGRELFQVDSAIAGLEEQLEKKKSRRKELTDKELPDYFTRVGQDRMGLPEFDVDLVLENFVHANIAADWEPEKREAAFTWLEDNGHGDLIKAVLTQKYPRTAMALARWVARWIMKLRFLWEKLGGRMEDDTPPDGDIPEPTIEMTVPWNTLTAWAKEQIKNGAELPLDTLGVTTGRVVKIKKREQPKKVKRT